MRSAPRPRSGLWRRKLALARSCDARLRSRWGMRLGKLTGGGIAVGFGVAMLSLAHDAEARLDAVTVTAAAWATWLVAGVAAYSAARHFADPSPTLARALAVQRGLGSRELASASLLAAMLRIALVCGVPVAALAVLAAALSTSASLLLGRALVGVALLGYVALVAAILTVLAGWSARLSAGRPGAALVAILIVPDLARQVWPSTPSVPALFEWLRHQLLSMGALLA